jgi:hypothetical protein
MIYYIPNSGLVMLPDSTRLFANLLHHPIATFSNDT